MSDWNYARLTGPSGGTGKGIQNITEYYKASANTTETFDASTINSWYTESNIPSVSPSAPYLLNAELITYDDGSVAYKAPHIAGRYVTDGRGITSITNHYLASSQSSGITIETSGWQTSAVLAPMTSTNKYLWNYETITYTDGPVDTIPCIIGVYGDTGTTPPVYYCECTMPDVNGAVDVYVYKDGVQCTEQLYYRDTYKVGNGTSTTRSGNITGHVTLDAVTATNHTLSIYTDNTLTEKLCTGFVQVGKPSTSWWLVSDCASIKYNGSFSPATVTLKAMTSTAGNSPTEYSGRFMIDYATVENPASNQWTNGYTSSQNESTKEYTIPAGVKVLRCSLYYQGGTTTMLDRDIIPVVDESYSCTVSGENFTVSTDGELKPLSNGAFEVKFTAMHGTSALVPVSSSGTITGGKFKVSKPTATGFTVTESQSGNESKLIFTPSTSTAVASQSVSVTVTYDNNTAVNKTITISVAKQGENAIQMTSATTPSGEYEGQVGIWQNQIYFWTNGAWVNQTPELPTDAVIHYSFDEVPDYPDGTADVRLLDNNTYQIQSGNYQFRNNTGCSFENINDNLQITGTSTSAAAPSTYINKTYTEKKLIIISIKVVSLAVNKEIKITNGDGSVISKFSETGVYKVAFIHDKIDHSWKINFPANETSTIEIQSIYIGGGSYSTPIIDNANGQNNATNNGGIAVKGVSGKGAYFLNGKYASISNFNLTPDFSVSAWVKPDNNTSGLNENILVRWNQFILRNGDSHSNTLRVYVYYADGTSSNYQVESLLTANVWSHIVVTRNGTQLCVYRDGTKKGTYTLTDGTIANISSSFYVGASNNTRTQSIDDVQIFNRALSEKEVLALYQNKANTPKYYDLSDYIVEGVDDDGIISPSEKEILYQKWIDIYAVLNGTTITKTSTSQGGEFGKMINRATTAGVSLETGEGSAFVTATEALREGLWTTANLANISVQTKVSKGAIDTLFNNYRTAYESLSIAIDVQNKATASALSISQSNSYHQVPTDAGGSATSYVGTDDVIYLLEGESKLECVATGATLTQGQWKIRGKNNTEGIVYTQCSGSTTMSNYTISDKGAVIDVLNGITADSAKRTFTIQFMGNNASSVETITVVQSFAKSKAGADGSSYSLIASAYCVKTGSTVEFNAQKVTGDSVGNFTGYLYKNTGESWSKVGRFLNSSSVYASITETVSGDTDYRLCKTDVATDFVDELSVRIFADGHSPTVTASTSGGITTISVDSEVQATIKRGTGTWKITTAPAAYTTQTGGFTPSYRISLSTVLSESGATEVLVGDVIENSYYRYPVGYVDSTYVYTGARTNIRGQNSYTYTRYSANADGTDFVSTPTSSTKYVGFYSGTSSTAPTSKASYTWSRYSADETKENLLHDSKELGSIYGSTYPYYKNIDNGTHTADAYNGFTQTYCNNSSGSSTKDFLAWKNIKGFALGDKYTLSFWAKGSGKLYTFWYGDTGYVSVKRINTSDGQSASASFSDGSTTFTLTSDWKQYWVTWQLNSTGDNTISKIILFRAYAGAQVYIAGAKFEHGISATTWVPHVDEYKGNEGEPGSDAVSVTLSSDTMDVLCGNGTRKYLGAQAKTINIYATKGGSAIAVTSITPPAASNGITITGSTTNKTITISCANNGGVTSEEKSTRTVTVLADGVTFSFVLTINKVSNGVYLGRTGDTLSSYEVNTTTHPSILYVPQWRGWYSDNTYYNKDDIVVDYESGYKYYYKSDINHTSDAYKADSDGDFTELSEDYDNYENYSKVSYALKGDYVSYVGTDTTKRGKVYQWNGASWIEDTDTGHYTEAMSDILMLADNIPSGSPTDLILNRLVTNEVLAKRMTALEVRFKNFVASLTSENATVGDEMVYMGKNPWGDDNTFEENDFRFAYATLLGTNGTKKFWRDEFVTKKDSSGNVNLTLSGGITGYKDNMFFGSVKSYVGTKTDDISAGSLTKACIDTYNGKYYTFSITNKTSSSFKLNQYSSTNGFDYTIDNTVTVTSSQIYNNITWGDTNTSYINAMVILSGIAVISIGNSGEVITKKLTATSVSHFHNGCLALTANESHTRAIMYASYGQIEASGGTFILTYTPGYGGGIDKTQITTILDFDTETASWVDDETLFLSQGYIIDGTSHLLGGLAITLKYDGTGIKAYTFLNKPLYRADGTQNTVKYFGTCEYSNGVILCVVSVEVDNITYIKAAYSLDMGNTFYTCKDESGTELPNIIGWDFAVSAWGKFVILYFGLGRCYLSEDYGKTFTAISTGTGSIIHYDTTWPMNIAVNETDSKTELLIPFVNSLHELRAKKYIYVDAAKMVYENISGETTTRGLPTSNDNSSDDSR